MATIVGNALSAGGGKKRLITELITANTTWTVPKGVTSISLRLFGGGGGAYIQTGGYGGHMAEGVFEVTPGDSYKVTIGAGGYGIATNSSTAFTATAGGTTSFGSLLSAAGGSSGQSGTSGGTGNGKLGAAGGKGSYGGGGGSGPSRSGVGGKGGNGGTYGGGGGGAGQVVTISNSSVLSAAMSGGSKGANGGAGGAGGAKTAAGADGTAGTNTVGLGLDFEGEGKAGKGSVPLTGDQYYYGGAGGGGGGYGGNGGDAYNFNKSDFDAGTIGGGGGGYGGNGGGGCAIYTQGSGTPHSPVLVSSIGTPFGVPGGGGGYGGNGGGLHNGAFCFPEGFGAGGGYSGGGGYGKTQIARSLGAPGICIIQYYA